MGGLGRLAAILAAASALREVVAELAIAVRPRENHT